MLILQAGGRKLWEVCAPTEPLATQHDDAARRVQQQPSVPTGIDTAGLACTRFELRRGDFLHLPRGTIHRASCLADAGSVHLTVSAMTDPFTWKEALLALLRSPQLGAKQRDDLRAAAVAVLPGIRQRIRCIAARAGPRP